MSVKTEQHLRRLMIVVLIFFFGYVAGFLHLAKLDEQRMQQIYSVCRDTAILSSGRQ